MDTLPSTPEGISRRMRRTDRVPLDTSAVYATRDIVLQT